MVLLRWDQEKQNFGMINQADNPLSLDSDQYQFSPDNIHMLLREMIMRGNKMITKEKML